MQMEENGSSKRFRYVEPRPGNYKNMLLKKTKIDGL